MGVGVLFLPVPGKLEQGSLVHRVLPFRIGGLQGGHHLPRDPADLDEQVGGELFPDDGLDIAAVGKVAGQFRPSRDDRRDAEGVRVVEEPLLVVSGFQLQERLLVRLGDEEVVLQQVEAHLIALGQLPPDFGVVDAELAHDPALRPGDLQGGDAPVQTAAAQRADARIIPEEALLVLHAFLQGELVLIAVPHELEGGVLREGVGESGQQVVEEAVLAGKVRLFVVLGDRIVRIAAEDHRHVHHVRVLNPVVEVGAVLSFREREEVLQPVQLGQVVGEGLVEEGEIGLQLHPLGLPELRRRFRERIHAHPVRGREQVLEGEIPVGTAVGALRKGQRCEDGGGKGLLLVLPGTDRDAVRILRGLQPLRRVEVQADALEDDVVGEHLAAQPAVPLEPRRHDERDLSVRIDGEMAAVVVHGDARRLLVRDEMDVPDGLDARNGHEDADDVARVQVRLPGEGAQFVRVDEPQARPLEAEDLVGLAAGGEEFLHPVERDGRAYVLVHPVVDVLQEGADVHVRVDFKFRAEADLDGLQERDVPEILAEVPVLPQEAQDGVPEQRLDVAPVDMVRKGLSVEVLSDDGQYDRIVLHRIQSFQLHEDVVIAPERRGRRRRLVGDVRDLQGLPDFGEPDVPHARDVFQDELPVVVLGRRGVREDELRGEQRSFQGRAFPAGPGEEVGHGGGGPV